MGELGEFSALRGALYSDLVPWTLAPAQRRAPLGSVALAAHLTGARSLRQLSTRSRVSVHQLGVWNLPPPLSSTLRSSLEFCLSKTLFRVLEV